MEDIAFKYDKNLTILDKPITPKFKYFCNPVMAKYDIILYPKIFTYYCFLTQVLYLFIKS